MTKRSLDTTICSKRLKDLRKEKGLTQKQLTELSGISIESIKNYETGRRIPDRYNAVVLGNALRVTPEYITGESEHRNWIEKYQQEHEEELKELNIGLGFWNYADSIGCTFEQDEDEEAETFFKDVTEYMKKKYQEMKGGEADDIH